MKKVLMIIPALLLAGILFYACQNTVDVTDSYIGNTINKLTCPSPGSGLEGVQALNCNDECSEGLSTTCNDEFTIEFLGRDVDGHLITFEYEVCRIGGSSDLSHWIFSLNLDCLGYGFTLEDAISKVEFNGEEITNYKIGLDPTTQLTGFKFDVGTTTQCNTYAITFDKTKLEEGKTLTTECGLAATKAGNQDIRPAKKGEQAASPGYVCIPVPVCIEEEVPCYDYECETAYGGENDVNVSDKNAWFYFYNNNGEVQTLWAGQNMEAGTVQYIDGKIYIILYENWSLEDYKRDKDCELTTEVNDESVKIQGYNEEPTSRPPSGLFTTYKGVSLEPSVDNYQYYIIHLDLVHRIEISCE
jgi:hypothetical protein